MRFKCPHCGYNNSFEMDAVEDNGYYECDDCGREMLVNAGAGASKAAYGSSASADALIYAGSEVTCSEEGALAIRKGDKAFQLVGNKLTPIVSKRESLIAQVPVALAALVAGDVVINPETRRAMFFMTATDNGIKVKDVTNNNTFDRDIVESDITGAVTVVKLLSINALFRSTPALVTLAHRYGQQATAEVVAKQYISQANVDVVRVEFELNPVMAQIASAQQLTILASALTAAKV